MPADLKKAYTGGRFAFEFDDRQSSGFVVGIDGGQFKSDPITYPRGGDFYVQKQAGRAKFEDISVTVGATMSPTFWKWVSASLAGKPERRNGAIVGYDFDFCERSRRTFFNALISEVGFPALDAASKNSATLSIKITPEWIEWKKGDGHSLRGGQAKDQMEKQKKWLTSNFKFTLERFKAGDTLRNCKIEAFSVKQTVIDNPIGGEKFARKAVGRLELPQLVVTFPEAHLEEWMKWYDAAVREGNRKEQYTSGAITYYANDTRTELMRVELKGVSLLSVELEKYEAHKEGIAMAKATLNVEEMALAAQDPGTVAA
jgi:phage tail-like protein